MRKFFSHRTGTIRSRLPLTIEHQVTPAPSAMARTGGIAARHFDHDPTEPLHPDVVQRILVRAIENAANNYDYILGLYTPRLIAWGTLQDGTTVGMVEDNQTGVRYLWTVHPVHFKPVSYGPVNA
ncbi:hypothetical protein GR138_18505 [Shinella kummerowiae]|jgi:hypothetical protein|uniref:Uncharacterized protein n=1 Tax=Shinella kummerowiae TaxID=417745 RepID=A0A6N8SJZ0_9HYPH|nr:hypothetical protein [Shinella kummerowiae]MXN47192.1 hypothetical protein [Shinella kummerowiae]